MQADARGNEAGRMNQSMSNYSANAGYFKDGNGNKEGKGYMHDKLSGNT